MNTYPKMHAGLHVHDVDATVAFYTKFFGTGPVKVKPGYAKFHLEEPALVISFIEQKDYQAKPFGHFGFQVETPEDLQIKLLEARKLGLVEKEEHETQCCYAKQDKFWVTDPDGISWEVYYFHGDTEVNDPVPASSCCA